MKQSYKVKQAFLQAGATLPGVFMAETNLTDERFPNIHMELWPDIGILVTAKDNMGITHTGFIPTTNIKMAVLDNETVSNGADAKAKSK